MLWRKSIWIYREEPFIHTQKRACCIPTETLTSHFSATRFFEANITARP